MSDWSQKRLIREEGAGMEADYRYDCCDSSCSWNGGGAAAGRHREHAVAPRRRETRLLRMAQLLVASLLLLTAGSLALLFMVGLQGRCARTEDQQVEKQLDNTSLDIGGKPEMSKLEGDNVGKKPSALLTAPVKRRIHGNRLNWENEKGDAFCRGGFNCSNWELVVPKKGIYRVFLQVTWRQDECSDNELLFKVEVIVFSDTYRQDRVVLSMFDTVTCRTYLTKSLFGSKFLKLTPNSRLHVNSTFPSLITGSEHEVFFGAELTDESPQ